MLDISSNYLKSMCTADGQYLKELFSDSYAADAGCAAHIIMLKQSATQYFLSTMFFPP